MLSRDARQLRQHQLRGGFTLLELVLVMVVLAIMLAVAVPAMRGFLGGSRARDAVSQVVSLAQYAKARAAADSTIYRLNVDGRAYWLTMQQGESFVPVGTEFGRRFELPEGMTITLLPGGDGSGGAMRTMNRAAVAPLAEPFDASGIAFHGDGRTGPGIIQLAEADGRVTLLAAPSPAESFRVVTPEEAAQL